MKNKELSLGDRLKQYESDSEFIIDPNNHMIIRIDGHHFSKYTKGFKKPFDSIFAEAMVLTTTDLVKRFVAYTGYTQSDEITLFIPSLKDITVDNRKKKTHKIHKRIREDWGHSFGGRTQKIASLVAAFTTMSFNKHFMKLLMEDSLLHFDNPRIGEKIGNAYFDARVYGVPDQDEVFNSFMWRVRDAEKNSRSMFAQTYCSHKELQGLNGEEQVQYCLEKTGKDWNNIEDKFKYGTFVKSYEYIKTGYHDLSDGTRALTDVKRSDLKTVVKDITTYNEDNVNFVVSKIFNED